MNNATEAYGYLNRFAGTWHTKGYQRDGDEREGTPIAGTDTYEWLPGGFFLLHKAEIRIGDAASHTHEIIGYDAEHGHFTLHYFNNKGESGYMAATMLDSGHWLFQGDELRFRGGFDSSGNLFSGIWERSDDGRHWTPFIDISLTRQ